MWGLSLGSRLQDHQQFSLSVITKGYDLKHFDLIAKTTPDAFSESCQLIKTFRFPRGIFLYGQRLQERDWATLPMFIADATELRLLCMDSTSC